MASVGLLKAVQVGAFPPAPGQARADTLGIKQRMADVLSAEDGLVYWTAFVGFMQGKLDRTEFELAVHRVLATEELISLHNALILSVLYNTTRAEPIPPTVRSHAGWNKRKRRPDGSKVEDRDPKRRRVKDAALALGKRERARLKSIAVAKELGRLGPPPVLKSERPPNVLATSLGPKVRIASSTLAQDYLRGSQTPLCQESKQLPEVDSLRDRMSLLAYDYGLGGGADPAAASILLIATEVHLKSLLGDILALVRADRSTQPSAGRPLENDSEMAVQPAPSASAAAEKAPVEGTDQAPALVAPAMDRRSTSSRTSRSDPELHGVVGRFRDFRSLGLAPPLQVQEFTNLWDISPHAFVQAHPPSLEWLNATRTPSEPSDDELEDDARAGTGDRDKSALSGKGLFANGSGGQRGRALSSDRPVAPAMVKTSTGTASAALGRDAPSPPKAPATDAGLSKNVHKLRVQMPPRPAFSPTADHDSAKPDPTPSGASGANKQGSSPTASAKANGDVTEVGRIRLASPAKDLAAQLFPEDEDDAKPARSASHRKARQSVEGAGSGSESDDAPLTATVNGIGGREKKKKHGWDRVDTFRLLEGV